MGHDHLVFVFFVLLHIRLIIIKSVGEYQAFKRAVEGAAPDELNLRDKDRYLWGKSFCKQLMKDVENESPPRKQEKHHTPK